MVVIRDIRQRPGTPAKARRQARAPVPAAPATVIRRRGDGPEDQALYRCGCGHCFHADVIATVDCPRCGAMQDW